MKYRRPLYHAILVMIIAGAILTRLLHSATAWMGFFGENEPLHSSMEMLGALVAVVMAGIMVNRSRLDKEKKFFLLAMGFLSMGILDGFHAVSSPGKGLVLLRSVAGLVGGFWCALVWLPGSKSYRFGNRWTLWIVAAASTLFGILVLVFPEIMPAMVQDGNFTSAAVNINLLAGVLFLAATSRFVLDFRRSGEVRNYLFACLCLLFGLAGLTFKYSTLWDSEWWLWHLLRLIAYLLVAGVLIRDYNQMVADLKISLAERERAEKELIEHRDHLEELVEERTAELKMSNAKLQREITEHKEAEERIAHLNSVLLAVRNVNQLISKGTDRDRLLQGVCDNLVEVRGYHNAWTTLMDETGLVKAVEAGLGEDFSPLVEQLKRGELPHCGRRALKQSDVVVIEEPSSTCADCPLAHGYGDRGGMAVRLEYDKEVYGIMYISVPAHFTADEEEQALFREVAGDIAFGLHNMEMEAARKRAEEELERKAEELARSNAELEQFAYVASHDLQEPLRKVQAFGDRLGSKYSETLDEQGQDYLRRMQNAAGRMQTLINDLLTFSRVATKGQPFVPVDLAQVAREVLSDLETRIERVGGRIELDELPTIDADPTQMRQLLQNLIGNGLKFHKEEESPVVKVYGQSLDGMCRISVEDNGIGFDEKYLDRIFTIFQRLRGRFEYEGTGVGLAVCRRIVERHGGEITAKSEPGHGATFMVTLPVKHESATAKG